MNLEFWSGEKSEVPGEKSQIANGDLHVCLLLHFVQQVYSALCAHSLLCDSNGPIESKDTFPIYTTETSEKVVELFLP